MGARMTQMHFFGRRTHAAVALLGLIASLAWGAAASADTPRDAGALLGTWQFDATKSIFQGAMPYRSATYTFKNTNEGVHVVVRILEGRDTTLNFEYVDRMDGTFVPVTGNPFYDSESTVWKDAYTAERTERRAGKITGATVFKVAKDGKSYTATASRTLPNGTVYTSVIAWNRVE